MVPLNRFLCLLVLSLMAISADGFVAPSQVSNYNNRSHKIEARVAFIPRGGSFESQTALNMEPSSVVSTIENVLFPALKSGPYGILAITAVTAATVIPLTLYRRLYSISVGYGAAIFMAGLCLQYAFQPATFSLGQALTGALMFYGIRLASYLLVREQTRKTPLPTTKEEGSIVQKLTLAASVSLFYALLSAPVMFALRNLDNILSSSTALMFTKGGIGLAFFGAILEAIGDLQKYIVKQSLAGSDTDQFNGPTEFTYRLCRHPNYGGEVLFWVGIFAAGVPSFGTNILAWVASSLGLFGIVSIMKTAAASLETKQKEKYGGQDKYDKWTKEVKSSLLPFF